MPASVSLEAAWRVNTPALLKEIAGNPQTADLRVPLAIFARLLAQVGERAAEINDKKLNALMVRLAIYSIADPYGPEFNADLCRQILEES